MPVSMEPMVTPAPLVRRPPVSAAHAAGMAIASKRAA
jgi:hypothetical protein